jgi:hypothetical protein
MKYLKALITVVIIGQLSLCISGCGKPKESLPEDKVIARINGYTMTAEDFRSSARSVGGTKEEALEELITRNILLQEAQKQNFDKDRAFMKEIERYWEQALLKLLVKKKMAEFSNVFNGDRKKVENAMDKWIKDLRARANVKVYKDNLSRTELP